MPVLAIALATSLAWHFASPPMSSSTPPACAPRLALICCQQQHPPRQRPAWRLASAPGTRWPSCDDFGQLASFAFWASTRAAWL
uniref:Secreted protein n=1 Tax=Macrostomum lignano TaxID=282301 RepID=A0A1I8HNL1_9PLAT